MSYDVNFVAKLEGIDKYVSVIDCEANITWNVKELIKQSSGWEIKNEAINGKARDIVELVLQGITNLTLHKNKYKQYESTNGWGTILGVLHFYNEIVKTWEELNYIEPDIVDITFIKIT